MNFAGPLILIMVGASMLAVSVAIAFNTSAGGTRSDYRDASGLVAFHGAVALVAGMAGVVLKVIFP